jgi:hypothetical protein
VGYTHYWTQNRNFTQDEWQAVRDDIGAIVNYAQHDCGIPLADCEGSPKTSPLLDSDVIMFNGLGDDAHESFIIRRVIPTAPRYNGDKHPEWDFCKTARKPYDDVVTACLCYLGSVTRRNEPRTGDPIIGSEVFSTTSDGGGSDFLIGLDLARKALPRVANQLDIPMPIMESDRWCAPWINDGNCKGYEVHFCIDGRGYVIKTRTKESYCFETHVALAQFLERTKHAKFRIGGRTGWGSYPAHEENIWNAYGSFDQARHARIAKAQAKVLATLFPVDPSCAQQPPAYVRPGEMPDNSGREFCYSVSDLLNLATKAA